MQKSEERERERKRSHGASKTVGLVTRCVLLLLYGGLLRHQNIKCPGKRACAWVHPHFTFTADCRLNRATFPRFLAPENALSSGPISQILSLACLPFSSTPVSSRMRSLALFWTASFSSLRRAHALLDITNFIRHIQCLQSPSSNLEKFTF